MVLESTVFGGGKYSVWGVECLAMLSTTFSSCEYNVSWWGVQCLGMSSTVFTGWVYSVWGIRLGDYLGMKSTLFSSHE